MFKARKCSRPGWRQPGALGNLVKCEVFLPIVGLNDPFQPHNILWSNSSEKVSIGTFCELSNGTGRRREGISGNWMLRNVCHPRPAGLPSVTLCHQFPPWKALVDLEQRSKRSFSQPNQFPGINTSTWKHLRAGTSLPKALSSCAVPVKGNSDIPHSIKIHLLPLLSQCSFKISMRLKTTPLFPSEWKMQFQSQNPWCENSMEGEVNPRQPKGTVAAAATLRRDGKTSLRNKFHHLWLIPHVS